MTEPNRHEEEKEAKKQEYFEIMTDQNY